MRNHLEVLNNQNLEKKFCLQKIKLLSKNLFYNLERHKEKYILIKKINYFFFAPKKSSISEICQ